MASTTRTCALVLCAAIALASSATGQRLPANTEAVTYAEEGLESGTMALSYISTSNATLAVLADNFLAAHGAAEGAFYTAYAGQRSGTIASLAAGGAALLASVVGLTNATNLVAEARSAISAAENLIAAIQDENPLSYDNATYANLVLAANIGHDATLVQYFQNTSSGPMDNATFADYVDFATGLPEVAEEQLNNSASSALVSIAAEAAARNLLGAIYVYEGNATAAYAQGLAHARLILKATNVLQSAAGCNGLDAMMYLESVNMAVEATTKAAESLSMADIAAAKTAAMSAANSNLRCAAVSPALAPASSTAALGRRMM